MSNDIYKGSAHATPPDRPPVHLISIEKPKLDNIPKVKVTSGGYLKDTRILVGDRELRATKIRFEVDNDKNMTAKLIIETYADIVDIEALQAQTELIITDRYSGVEPSQIAEGPDPLLYDAAPGSRLSKRDRLAKKRAEDRQKRYDG